MKLTTRSINVVFISYYEFYSLQTTNYMHAVQFSLYCDIFLELRVCYCQFVNVYIVQPIDILYKLDSASLLVKLKPRLFQRLPPFE